MPKIRPIRLDERARSMIPARLEFMTLVGPPDWPIMQFPCGIFYPRFDLVKSELSEHLRAGAHS